MNLFNDSHENYINDDKFYSSYSINYNNSDLYSNQDINYKEQTHNIIIREEIKSIQKSIALLRQDLPKIVHDELNRFSNKNGGTNIHGL